MLRILLLCLIYVAFFAIAGAQEPQEPLDHVPHAERETRLPNGKLQSDEILRAEREQSLKDVHQMTDLVQSLQKDLEQEGSQNVLSLADVHRTEEIERLAKRIRARLKRY